MLNILRRKKSEISASKGNTTVLLNGVRAVQAAEIIKKRFRFSGSVVSDAGSVRANNEDNYVLGQYINHNSADHSETSVSFSDTSGDWQFAGVFDGMGGGEMGELASRDTAAIFLAAFRRISGAQSKAEVDLTIRSAFLEANNRIVALQKEYRVFGTTGTVLCSNGLEFKLYHLGDSRAYLVRGDELLQLTKDQTLAQMKLEVGMYNEDDPAAEADKHKLTEYIGRDWTKENLNPVESLWLPIESGDHILLCSDGLYDMCSNEEIAEILWRNASTSDKAVQLVRAAVSHGGEDNVTCIVVAFTK